MHTVVHVILVQSKYNIFGNIQQTVLNADLANRELLTQLLVDDVTVVFSKIRGFGSILGFKPDVLLSYAINYYLPEILIRIVCGSYLITERRNQYHWIKQVGRNRIQELIRNYLTQKVVCNSESVAVKVRSYEPEVIPKIVKIHNGVRVPSVIDKRM